MNKRYILYVPPLLLLFSTAVLMSSQQQKAFACGLDDLTSCFSAAGVETGPYYAGQQDAIYDHNNGLAYNNVAACCHPEDWNNEFAQGYDHQWNQYQSQDQNTEQRTNVNINGNDNVVNVGQTSNNDQEQNQGPSTTSVACGLDQCGNSCSDNGPCGGPCSGSCGPAIGGGPGRWGFHHFHFWHEGCGFGCGGYGYRHIGFWHGGEDQ